MPKIFFWGKNFFDPKTSKNVIFGSKMVKNENFWSKKIFLVGIDSECFETYFKTKIPKSKIFSRVKFFCGTLFFSAKMTKIVEKWQSQKNLVEKFFLVEIDSECFGTYFKTKISKSKIFSCVNFFSGTLFFRPKWPK